MDPFHAQQCPRVTDIAPPALGSPFDALFDHAPMGMLLADLDGVRPGRLIRVNAAMERITGYRREELLTMTLADLTHPSQLSAHRRRLADVASGRGPHSAVHRRWIRGDGREIVVQFNASTVGGADDRQLFGMVDDLADRSPTAGHLPEQSAHDPLTGLPDPALLAGRIAQVLRTARPAALLHVQLDDLDRCRDVFGPAAADELLCLAARRLTDNVRPGDTVARGGRDHFVVVCPDLRASADSPTAPVGDVRGQLTDRLLAALAAPYRLGGIVHHVPARIGSVLTRARMTVPQALAELAAELPEERSGRRRRSAGIDFPAAPALLGTAAAARHVAVENELLQALREDALVMFGQPIITVGSGRIGAVEMLLRWRHPVRGLLGPAAFLDVAEASPLMEQVGRRVLRESCRIAAGWPAAPGFPAPAVFVNVSGRQLESGRLPDDVAAALRDAGLPANRLVLELTETCAPLLGAGVLADLAAVRSRGVRLAVDDVGTGYSTLARLTELPIDILKIDRTFVAGLGRQCSADAVVRAIMHISRTLGLPVVAEGIETVEQAAAVAAHGCDAAQGYLYARPCPEDELALRLSAELGHRAVRDVELPSDARGLVP